VSIQSSRPADRIGHWIEFRKIDGDGPDSGWLKYYGNGKRVAKRTAANDIAIMQSNVVIVPEKVWTLAISSAYHASINTSSFSGCEDVPAIRDMMTCLV